MDILINKDHLSSRLGIFSYTAFEIHYTTQELSIRLRTSTGYSTLQVIELVPDKELPASEALLHEMKLPG